MAGHGIAWETLVARVIDGRSRIMSSGYRQLYVPMHPWSRKSYVYEHRLVMEQKLGRRLERHEHVHHVNGDKLDNRAANLEIVTGSRHQVIHHSGISDDAIRDMLRLGFSQRQIVAHGVSGHRVVRLRREVAA